MTPDKVYVKKEKNNVVYSLSVQYDNGGVEYIRKDIVDETIKTAEDHAYFAGQEKFREKLIKWLDEQLTIIVKQTLLHPDDDVFWGQRNAYKQMKDKLNSL